MAQSVSIRRFQWIAAAFSGFCLIGGGLSLAGWTTSIPWLADWFAAGWPTGPFAATAALLSALAVICLIARQYSISTVLGILTVATGVVALFKASGSSTEWLYVAPVASIAWILLGCAIILLSRYRADSLSSGGLIALNGAFAFTAAAFGIAALAPDAAASGLTSPNLGQTLTVTLQTAMFILAASTALTMVNVESEPMRLLRDPGPAGAMGRKALPLILVVALVFGLVHFVGGESEEPVEIVRTLFRGLFEFGLLAALILWLAKGVETASAKTLTDRDALRKIADSMPQVVWIANSDGVLEYTNERAKGFFASANNGNGGARTALPEVHGDDLEAAEAAWQASRSRRDTYVHEHRIKMPDGTYRWHLTRAVPVLDKVTEEFKWYGTATDIDALKNAAELNRANEERFTRFMENLPGLAWIKDHEGRYVFANEAAARAFGYPQEKLYGNTDADLFPPETAKAFIENDKRAVEQPNGILTVEDLHEPDGGLRHSLVSKFAIEGTGSGTMVGGIAIDITDRKRAEDDQAFLFRISEFLRREMDPDFILNEMSRELGAYLKVDRCMFVDVDVDADRATVVGEYSQTGDRVDPIYKVSDYSEVNGKLMQSGKTVSVADTRTDPATRDRFASTYEPNGELSYIAVPHLRNGLWNGTLWCSDSQNRTWNENDISLVESVAQLTWSAIERHRFTETLESSRKALSDLIERAPFGLYIIDSDFRMLTMNGGSQTGAFANVNPVIGRDFDEILHIVWPADAAAELSKVFHHTMETGASYVSSDFIEERKDVDAVEAYEWEVHRISLPDGRFGVVCYYFNSTSLREAQVALGEREAQLEAIYKGSFGYLGLLSAEGIVLDANRSSLQFGPVSRFDVVGKPFWETVWFAGTPNASEKVRVGLRHAANGEFVRYEMPLIKPDGETAYLDFSLRPIRGKDDETKFIVPEWRDITELKRVEDEIRKISRMPEENPSPEMRLSAEGRVIYANPAARSLIEFWRDRTGNDVDPEVTNLIAYVLHTGQREEVELAFEDRFFACVIAPVTEGAYVNFYAADITERKRSEAALKESEQRFRHASDSAPVLIWMSDYSKRGFWFNKPWLEYTGRTLADEANDGWTEGIHADDLQRTLRIFNSAFERREPFSVEYRLRRHDGEYSWMLNNGAPRFSGEGAFMGYIASCVDINDRLSTERALRRSEARLQLAARVGSFGMWDINYQTEQVVWSDKLFEILGLEPRSLDPMTIDECRELVSSAGAEWLVTEAADISKQQSRERSFQSVSTGESRWIHYTSQLFFSENGGPPIRSVGVVQDVTERRSAEETIRQSEERLRLAQEAGNVGIWDWDAASDRTYWSDQMWTLYGRAPEQHGPVEPVWAEYIYPDDRTRVLEKLNAAKVNDASDYYDEFRIVRPDGSIRWIESNATVDCGPDGNACRIYGMNRDTTEKRAAEELLRKSEHQMRLVTDSIPALVSFIGRDRRYRFANGQYHDWFGFEPDELIGKTMSEVLGDDTAAEIEPRIDAVIAGEKQTFEMWLNTNNVPRYVLISYVPHVRDDGVVDGFYALLSDMTEQKRSQDLLSSSEERMRMLTESFSDYAIISTNVEGVIVSWNHGAENIFGWSEDEIIGKHSHVIFTPEDVIRGIPEHEMQSARTAGRALDERWHIRKDGSRFFASGVMAPLYVADELTGFAKIATDLTEKKRNAEALQRAYDEMEMRVLERTRELSETNAALFQEISVRKTAERQQIGLLQRLVTGQEQERTRIARDIHDTLGQRLTALRLKLASLLDACRMGEDREGLIARAMRLKRVAEILDNEVSFLAWELRPVVLDELGLSDAMETFVKEWARHHDKQADFVVTGLADIRLDPETETHLYRITQEALNNVLKHAEADHVNVLLGRSGDNVVLIVEDDGRGFDQEDVEAREPGKGGLGISGMHERAELIGATLEIESAPGSGTTIYVKLTMRNLKEMTANE